MKPIRTFVSVRPDGRVVRYRKSPDGIWRKNPLPFELSGFELALIGAGAAVVGVIGYLFWKASQPSSPAISVASGSSPSIPDPLLSGLASGYYWEDQGNTQTPSFASLVKAIAMSPDDVASTVSGNVIVPLTPGGNVTFIATAASESTGIAFGQAITLPLSYVTAT